MVNLYQQDNLNTESAPHNLANGMQGLDTIVDVVHHLSFISCQVGEIMQTLPVVPSTSVVIIIGITLCLTPTANFNI